MAKLPHDEDDIALPPSGSQYTTPRALVKEVGPEHLGNTFDSKFELVGKSIFPEAAVATTPLNSYNSETLIVEDKFTFDLNVRAWNIVSGAFGFLNDRRVVAIRNFQITDMLTIDDSAIPMQAPMNASYYLWRLYKGHMVEIIIQGDKSMFTAGVKSSILKGGVGIQYLKDHYGLSADINAQGAKPIDKESMFSLNVGDKVPLTTEGVEDVAIFAKYRLIPGRPLPKADPIEFEPYVFKSGKYSMNINNIVVRNTDSDGTFWDNGEASPEIYIKVYRKTADGFLELIFKTATVPAMNPVSDPDGISNLISANLNSKQSVTLSPDDILVLKVFDADDWWNPDDFVGECYTGPLNELQEDSMEISSCGQVDKIELEFSLKK